MRYVIGEENMQKVKMRLQCKSAKIAERFWMKLAWILPRSLVYFASIRLVAFATMGRYGNTVVPELTAMDAIQRWEK